MMLWDMRQLLFVFINIIRIQMYEFKVERIYGDVWIVLGSLGQQIEAAQPTTLKYMSYPRSMNVYVCICVFVIQWISASTTFATSTIRLSCIQT